MTKSTKAKRTRRNLGIVSRPGKRQSGHDNAWPDCPLVDGRALQLLWEAARAWQDLAELLDTAEQAAAIGQNDVGIANTTGYRSAVESRLGVNGELTDLEVRRYRNMRDRWIRKFGKLVDDMQVDLGQREAAKGQRDNQGRLKILAS